MTKSARTRQFILEKTAPLFNSKGFEGTSLADLTSSTGLTKGALYGNFHDKEEMAREAFQYAIDKVKGMVRIELDGLATYKKQLIALLEFYASYVLNPPVAGGCPLLNTAIEADDYRTNMRKVVTKELQDTVDFISILLQKGVQAGEFKNDIDPEEMAYTFFCSIEGALMFSRVARSKEPMEMIVRHCKRTLELISK
jgi:TetR/AcrR family transcriptional regulator, transcriptional repressor for nem operon